MNTPVVIIAFNRPNQTSRLLEALRLVKPSQLFVVTDGPREHESNDAELCRQVNRIIESTVDWKCNIYQNRSETNLGCGRRIATGLDWVFEQVEEAIILEDDCIPHPSFFRFCEEMLERYRGDDQIMHIGGNNFQDGIRRGSDSYFFSRYNHIWGWATWRRAWNHFDHQMREWPLAKAEGTLRNLLSAPGEYEYWCHLFDEMVAQKPWPKSWGYAWTYACFKNGISIYPNVNLVTNIGFGADATHCVGDAPHANLPAKEMEFPLLHPKLHSIDEDADAYTLRQHFGVRPFRPAPLPKRLFRRAQRLFRLPNFLRSEKN